MMNLIVLKFFYYRIIHCLIHPEILIQSYFKLLQAYIFTFYTHNYKLHPVLVDSSSLAILSLENWL